MKTPAEQTPVILAHAYVCQAVSALGRTYSDHLGHCACPLCKAWELLHDAANHLAWQMNVERRRELGMFNNKKGPTNEVLSDPR